MNGSFKIGTIYGIPVLLHWSFLLIIPFFAWIIGSQIILTAELIENWFNITINKTLITAGITPYILGMVVALG
ncbi:MAG: peptidase M50, partial [Methanoregulaceae archaeon]|nr:peptidase M50 [Methanoregulaceae archaeon]